MKSSTSIIVILLLSVLSFAFTDNPIDYFLRVSGNRPFGIAFDKRGLMYMVTAPPTGNGTLSKITPDGKVTELTTLKGTFIGPGITIDDESNILVTVGDRLLKITPYGKTEVVADGFSRCFDVKLDKSGNIYVADDTRGIVYRIDSSSKKETFYKSDSTGSFMLTGLCFDSRCENLFVRDGKKLLKFHFRSGGDWEKPEVVLDNVDVFYICIDSSDNIYASTIKNVIKIDSHGKIENLARRDLKTSIGLAIGCKGFDENSIYVAVDDGIVRLPMGKQ